MMDNIKIKDWDNFKNLKEFIEAEKLSQHLQKKIHEFHESFLISKSYTIDELAKVPNLNWLYVRPHQAYNHKYDYLYSDSFEIALRGFQFNTRCWVRSPAGTNYSRVEYEPNDYELKFNKLICETVKFKKEHFSKKTHLITKEQAEKKCQECNDLIRDKITEFVIFEKQNQRFILDTNNSPIGIITNDCTFKINEKDNQLIIGTTSQKNEKELKINGVEIEFKQHSFDFYDFRLTPINNHYDLVFDIPTNNLIDVIKTQ